MNHSGNEHLSSGSPQAQVLTKDFASNIWNTLYLSTGQGCWNTAHVMECFTESDAGGKTVFSLHGRKTVGAIRQHDHVGECKWLCGQMATDLCFEANSIHSAFKMYALIHVLLNLTQKKKNHKGVLESHNKVRTTSKKKSDKVHCIYLCLLLLFCLDSI